MKSAEVYYDAAEIETSVPAGVDPVGQKGTNASCTCCAIGSNDGDKNQTTNGMPRCRRVWRGLSDGVHAGTSTGRTVDQTRGGSRADREPRPGSATVYNCISRMKVALMMFIYSLQVVSLQSTSCLSAVYKMFICSLQVVSRQSTNCLPAVYRLLWYPYPTLAKPSRHPPLSEISGQNQCYRYRETRQN